MYCKTLDVLHNHVCIIFWLYSLHIMVFFCTKIYIFMQITSRYVRSVKQFISDTCILNVTTIYWLIIRSISFRLWIKQVACRRTLIIALEFAWSGWRQIKSRKEENRRKYMCVVKCAHGYARHKGEKGRIYQANIPTGEETQWLIL